MVLAHCYVCLYIIYRQRIKSKERKETAGPENAFSSALLSATNAQRYHHTTGDNHTATRRLVFPPHNQQKYGEQNRHTITARCFANQAVVPTKWTVVKPKPVVFRHTRTINTPHNNSDCVLVWL